MDGIRAGIALWPNVSICHLCFVPVLVSLLLHNHCHDHLWAEHVSSTVRVCKARKGRVEGDIVIIDQPMA